MAKSPKIFISYSHDNPKHKKWVANFAKSLCEDGIETILDQSHLRLGEDVAAFMENGLHEADRVVVICTPQYVEKANSIQGGVGYEKMIITGQMMHNLGTIKFIPVIAPSNPDKLVPNLLSNRLFLDLSSPSTFSEQYEYLVKELHSKPAGLKPAVSYEPNSENEILQSFSEKAVSDASFFFKTNPLEHEIMESIHACLRSQAYPKEMAINDSLFHNPVYDYMESDFLRALLKKSCRFMPLDIYLIKAIDTAGQPVLLQYFSGNAASGWQCWLFPHGYRPEESEEKIRLKHNARDFEAHCRLRRSSVTIDIPENRPFAVSIKPDFGYQDQLVIYVYNFYFLSFSFVPKKIIQGDFVINHNAGVQCFYRWMSLEEMSVEANTRERNADIHRCIHQLFRKSLIDVQPTFTKKIQR
ncbi:MAG: hypothetical protein CSA49_03715 [Gammaproteobacteria bacterium]|nr:MAG: hypothetical protein CSA49_03715 [Gammaproteobacteria bacterium]